MRFRKLISIWTLLALMLGQYALAQHSVTHIDHGFSQEIVASHHDHNHDEDQQKHECPECSLTKSLQTAFYHAPTSIPFSLQLDVVILQTRSPTVSINRYKANAPRAPPAILI